MSARPAGPLVIVGYGVVGRQVAQLVRRRNPGLPLVIAGRHPAAAAELADALGAATAAIDVRAERPLLRLRERPAAVLAAAGDPDDRLLVDAMRLGIPIADIDRAGHGRVLDASLHAARERPRAPVLLSGSWMSGATALAAAAAARDVGGAERIEIAVLGSSGDRVGPAAWGWSARLAAPYRAMADGERRAVQPLTRARRVRCPDGRRRIGVLVETLEQTTLPLTLGVRTVETRLAPQTAAAACGLIALKRSGAIRALEHPALHGLRDALFHRGGRGDFAGFTVTAEGGGRASTVEVLDVRGQAHLSAVAAALAAERVLAGGDEALAPGISFPEQAARPQADLAALRGEGIVVRAPAGAIAPAAHPVPAPQLRLAAAPTTPEEEMTA